MHTSGAIRRRECANLHRFTTQEMVVINPGVNLRLLRIEQSRERMAKGLELVAKGYTTRQVAQELQVNISTVERWRQRARAA
jgi:FixJ family two-component response regulator